MSYCRVAVQPGATILRDIRHALRTLGRAPGYTIAVTLTLALGIGGTTAVYSVLRSVILRPFSWAPADRFWIVVVESAETASRHLCRQSDNPYRDSDLPNRRLYWLSAG